MIVMSKQARLLLNKMQEQCSTVEYEATDVEWYAHNFTLSLLNSWWKSRKKNEGCVGDTHIRYLPDIKSREYKELLTYVTRLGGKMKQFELNWTNNHKQVYYYLCSNVLDCDFNMNEFKIILDIGSEFDIQHVQHMADKIRGTNGSNTVQYLAAVLTRDKQAKDNKVQRVCEAIKTSQRCLKKISSRPSTFLEVALMKRSFKDIIETDKIERIMNALKRPNRSY